MIFKEEQKECQEILKQLHEDINELIQQVESKFQATNISLEKDNNLILSEPSYFIFEEIQEEIANQVILLQHLGEHIAKIQRHKNKYISECIILRSKLNSIKLAISFLLTGKTQKIVFAKNIRYGIEYFLNSKKSGGWLINFFKQAVREWSAPTKVLLGLAMALPLYTIAVPGSLLIAGMLTIATNINLSPSVNNSRPVKISERLNKLEPTETQLFFERYTLVLVSGIAGTFGSIISILLRLKQYRDSAYKGSAAPILVGFAKPLIGTAFGILVFTIVNSNIISTVRVPESNQSSEDNEIKYYFFFSLAFVVGFSERLAGDIIHRAESTLLPETANKLKEAGENFQISAKDIHAAGEDFQNSAKNIQAAAVDLKQTTSNESNDNSQDVESDA
ncbi:hypothetical protein FD725_05430 [Nostoc sp. TCL26-01]|nr:hypothetical protein FD725_05430 [Nostoc sp. TCL26-01]